MRRARCLDGHDRRPGCGHGGGVGQLVLDRGLADVGVIQGAAAADGGVDHQVQLAIGDEVGDVGTAFVELQDHLGGDAVLGQELVGAGGGAELEAQAAL